MAWVQEIFETLYDPNTVCVACISHGKDSLAMLRAIKLLGLPLHMIVTSDVWATQDIPADLPEMWEWKKEADRIIKDLYGIEVEHICARQTDRQTDCASNQCSTQLLEKKESLPETSKGSLQKSENGAKSSNLRKLTYEDIFYRRFKESRKEGRKRVRICNDTQSILPRGTQEYTVSQCNEGIGVKPTSSQPYGFPISVRQGQWCQRLKLFSPCPKNEGRKINIIQYLGIAADEPLRIKKHIGKTNVILPLVEIGWEEDLCGLISGYQDLLSPVYNDSSRDGCWFCHNQSIGQLRLLRKKHPDLWNLLLKWDADSPVSFKPDGRTVHDFDERFALEDQGIVSPDDPWKWKYLAGEPIQLKIRF